MYLDINDEDEDLDNVVDTEEDGGSRLSDAQDKIENAKNKIEDAKDLVDRIKNNSNKSGSPEGPSTKSSKQSGENNGSTQNSTNQSQSNQTGSTSGNANDMGGKTSGSNKGTGGNSTGAQTGGTTGAPSGAGGSSTGAGASSTAGTGAGSTAGASGAGASGGATAGGAAAGGTAAGGAAAGGTAAGGAAAAAATPVGWVIIGIIVVVLIIMMIIGFVSFFTDGIGLIGEKIMEFADGIWTAVKSEFVGKSEAQVKEENIVEIGKYLEQMGYDLEGFGFLNSNGKGVTKEDKLEDDGTGTGTQTGTRTIKNSDGEVILQRKITKSSNGEITEGEITSMKSDCIWEYLVAENKTYIVKNVDRNLLQYFIPGWGTFVGIKDLVFGDSLNDGMIEVIDDTLFGESTSSNLTGTVKHIAIDREKNELIISLKHSLFSGYDKYAYSLDGWTGKYGKPLEFLLTLHLATMSPDFAEEVAKNKEFDALVQIKFRELYASIRLLNKDGIEITESNYGELGFTKKEWEAIKKYNKEIKTYTPYIRKVTNHWFYKEIDFAGAYEEEINPDYDKNNPKDNTKDKHFTYEYEYVGLGEEDDILVDKGLIVREIRNSDIIQKREPVVTKREYKAGELSLQTILLGGDPGSENTNENYKFYIYNGSSVPEGTERDKRYIMQKVQSGENTEYVMDTRFFQYAFSILESTHTQDAEYILRDLKELFSNLGIDISGEDSKEEVGELKWILPGYTPVAWDPMFNTTETEVRIDSKENDENGFEANRDVVMPGDR